MNITVSYNDLTTSFILQNIELQEEILKNRNQSDYIQNLLLTGFTISKTMRAIVIILLAINSNNALKPPPITL